MASARTASQKCFQHTLQQNNPMPPTLAIQDLDGVLLFQFLSQALGKLQLICHISRSSLVTHQQLAMLQTKVSASSPRVRCCCTSCIFVLPVRSAKSNANTLYTHLTFPFSHSNSTPMGAWPFPSDLTRHCTSCTSRPVRSSTPSHGASTPYLCLVCFTYLRVQIPFASHSWHKRS